MTITQTFSGGKLMVSFQCTIETGGATATGDIGVFIDAAAAPDFYSHYSAPANHVDVVTLDRMLTTVSAASHTITIKWRASAGTLTNQLTYNRTMAVIDLGI